MTDHDARILMALCALALATYAFIATVRYIARKAARNEVMAFLKAGMLPSRDKHGKFKRKT